MDDLDRVSKEALALMAAARNEPDMEKTNELLELALAKLQHAIALADKLGRKH